eukprot:TRINITY_DN7515_c0_g1_i6.p1 TRINITY_DN7515_c0_g1~~TRINITY_DN7515_c0_g1_i6.p1  ORF type:complete len:203 (+),score=37.36 TRINITY_DN7515_c0_g1_i6:174-782(+)
MREWHKRCRTRDYAEKISSNEHSIPFSISVKVKKHHPKLTLTKISLSNSIIAEDFQKERTFSKTLLKLNRHVRKSNELEYSASKPLQYRRNRILHRKSTDLNEKNSSVQENKAASSSFKDYMKRQETLQHNSLLKDKENYFMSVAKLLPRRLDLLLNARRSYSGVGRLSITIGCEKLNKINTSSIKCSCKDVRKAKTRKIIY